MFFLRIEEPLDGGLDRVQMTDETFRFLLEIEGRAPAIEWLVRHGCCPGAAARLTECDYGQTYNIASRTGPAGAHAML